MISKQTIEEVKQRLIKTYDPVEIYIFGSYAWGKPDEESDLDVAIVVDKVDDRYKALVQGHWALADLPLSKDLLLYTKQEFDEYSQDQTRFCYKIKQKGRRIYARA